MQNFISTLFTLQPSQFESCRNKKLWTLEIKISSEKGLRLAYARDQAPCSDVFWLEIAAATTQYQYDTTARPRARASQIWTFLRSVGFTVSSEYFECSYHNGYLQPTSHCALHYFRYLEYTPAQLNYAIVIDLLKSQWWGWWISK